MRLLCINVNFTDIVKGILKLKLIQENNEKKEDKNKKKDSKAKEKEAETSNLSPQQGRQDTIFY